MIKYYNSHYEHFSRDSSEPVTLEVSMLKQTNKSCYQFIVVSLLSGGSSCRATAANQHTSQSDNSSDWHRRQEFHSDSEC